MKSRRRGFKFLYSLLLLLAFLLAPPMAFGEKPTKENPLVVIEDRKEILISGYVQAKKYNQKPLWPHGHTKNWHAIVWEGGQAQNPDILFLSRARDLSVYEALIRLGASPGNNLSSDTWDQRGYLHHPEPNKKVEGTAMKVSVTWEGAPRTYSLRELLDDPGGKGISLKFGGHKELISVWKSGCIVCLYSCPGGKISNAAYSANDYVSKATHFSAREDILPPDGTEVIISISINEPE